MKSRSIRTIVVVTLLLVTGIAAADTVGFGLTVADDFPDVPDQDEIYSRFFGSAEVVPGFLVFFKEYDWGMSFDFGFDFYAEGPASDSAGPMWMDFDFTASYDWHPFPRFVLDPFLQLGGGIDMAAPLDDEGGDAVLLGFHPLLGAGANFFFGNIYLRASLQYQGLILPIPAPEIDPYEAGPYRVLLSAGFLFR